MAEVNSDGKIDYLISIESEKPLNNMKKLLKLKLIGEKCETNEFELDFSSLESISNVPAANTTDNAIAHNFKMNLKEIGRVSSKIKMNELRKQYVFELLYFKVNIDLFCCVIFKKNKG